MARETKEDRAAREQREQEAAEAALAVYRASIPARLMHATALASGLGVSADVSLTATGPSVHFYTPWEENKIGIDERITYETEEWELEAVERMLAQLKEEQDARAARRVVAQSVFDSLSTEQKAAIKEHIYMLR